MIRRLPPPVVLGGTQCDSQVVGGNISGSRWRSMAFGGDHLLSAQRDAARATRARERHAR